MTTTLENIVTRRHQPWLPSAEASELDVWNAFGTPALGTFKTPSGSVLFYSINGRLMESDFEDEMWGYLPISDQELAEMKSVRYDNIDAMEDDVESKLDGRPIVVAWSVSGVVQAHTECWGSSDFSAKAEGFRETLIGFAKTGQLQIAVYFETPAGVDTDRSDSSADRAIGNIYMLEAGDLVHA